MEGRFLQPCARIARAYTEEAEGVAVEGASNSKKSLRAFSGHYFKKGVNKKKRLTASPRAWLHPV